MEFNEKNLKAAFQRKKIGTPLYFFTRTESTNNIIFKLAEQGASEGTSVFADYQSGGKGRMKRKWESPPGVNLYSSVLFRPEINLTIAPAMTLMAGVAVADLISYYCSNDVRLKWPNDVLVNDKKICGILSEIKVVDKKIKFIVVGIGININIKRDEFPLSINGIATSLFEETGVYNSRIEVAVKLFDNLGKYYSVFMKDGFAPIRERWLNYSLMVGKYCEVMYGSEVCKGTVSGIDDKGALLMITKDGKEQRIVAGDVSIVKG